MKILVLFVVLLFSQSAQSENDVSGQWRGLLKLTPQSAIVLGIGIKKTDSNVTVVVNSPNQGMPDRPVDEFTLEDNQLHFKVEELGASFTGTFEDNTLTGTFTQRKAFDITLHRLSEKQQARLINERQWFGNLQVSPNAELPLVLNIAVIGDRYHVTLDSPQQQSYGIPVNEFSLTDKQLTFASSMINASYKGNWQDDSWQGTFVQGMAMPLTFKKKPPH
ncbi:hypothetical protein [Lacimicrobium alkaliphilum]|uniref:Lipid/polyisoprenoid-binding YceI-like domain-containing protein n=1 Tax=Lacimicrobium alkaliphilum TaxID=1526571 RepID=A0A0U2JK12_9ALTE|nr:hypothetical protein [Lacimicrobium alkaliphilum]ALT00439.1 hypothetical protein AT746_12095 [Lacimicrobium alkaliphilum]